MFTRFMVNEIIVICFICQHQHIFKKSRMLKTEKEIIELLEGINEIFKSGILEYYLMRPKQNYVEKIWFAAFTYYYFEPAKVKNDCQPDCLSSNTTLVDSSGLALPKKLRLLSSLTMDR